MKTHKKQVNRLNNNDPDWVSNGKQTARKCFQEGRRTKRAHRLTSLHTVHRDGTKKKRWKCELLILLPNTIRIKMTWRGNLDVLKMQRFSYATKDDQLSIDCPKLSRNLTKCRTNGESSLTITSPARSKTSIPHKVRWRYTLENNQHCWPRRAHRSARGEI